VKTLSPRRRIQILIWLIAKMATLRIACSVAIPIFPMYYVFFSWLVYLVVNK
jgi:hypothetical protein